MDSDEKESPLEELKEQIRILTDENVRICLICIYNLFVFEILSHKICVPDDKSVKVTTKVFVRRLVIADFIDFSPWLFFLSLRV